MDELHGASIRALLGATPVGWAWCSRGC